MVTARKPCSASSYALRKMNAHRLATSYHFAYGVKNEFIQPVNITSRRFYPIPNFTGIHHAVRVNVMKPAWMRAPGEAPCQFALESAVDEIASNWRLTR